MRKWMRDRNKRRNKPGQGPSSEQDQQQTSGEAPLQPTFLDRVSSVPETAASAALEPSAPEPEYEAQPEHDPMDSGSAEDSGQPERGARRERSRRRGRGGRGRRGAQPQQRPATLPIDPGQATGEAAEVDGDSVVPSLPETPAAPKKEEAPAKGKSKGAVVLAIGLPGSGKSSWFKRHNIVPLSSDLIRGLLFDDPTEQRYQDLVFSTLRSLLRARLVAGRPMNYIDATNLSPKERHSWIRMAHDFNYEAHAVFFDVPTEVCMERNRKRSRNVPDEVMVRMSQKLRPPKFEEGFSKVTIVRLKLPEKREGSAEPEAPEIPDAAPEIEPEE